jgi:hypothetical protein
MPAWFRLRGQTRCDIKMMMDRLESETNSRVLTLGRILSRMTFPGTRLQV